MIAYHDDEWGVPSHDDRHLFEMLILEGAQAGLMWRTILHKRAGYRRAFDRFDAKKIARYDARRVRALLSVLAVKEEFGTFDAYIWSFVGGKPVVNRWKRLSDLPARTAESDAMSKDLKKRGFRFVGSTICYAFMQATGMVDDHTVDCFRRARPRRTT
jgi:DNA-3-methyladenine glycosylase I